MHFVVIIIYFRGEFTVKLGSLKSNLNLNDLFIMLESFDIIIIEKELFPFFIRDAKLNGVSVFVGVRVPVVSFELMKTSSGITVVSPK
jgi:hypothetical protein